MDSLQESALSDKKGSAVMLKDNGDREKRNATVGCGYCGGSLLGQRLEYHAVPY